MGDAWCAEIWTGDRMNEDDLVVRVHAGRTRSVTGPGKMEKDHCFSFQEEKEEEVESV